MKTIQKCRKIIVYILVAMLFMGNISIAQPTQIEAAQKVTSIELNYNTYVLKKKQSIKLKGNCLPKTAKNKKLKWKSSKKSVATVSSNGKVTAKKTGTAKITAIAKDGSGKKAVCTIKVVKKITKIKSLKITAESKELKQGDTVTLKAQIKPAKATLKTLKWESSDEEVATVTQKGVVKAVQPGTVKITAKAQDGSKKSAVYILEVKNQNNSENTGDGNSGNDGNDNDGNQNDENNNDGNSGVNPGGDQTKPGEDGTKPGDPTPDPTPNPTPDPTPNPTPDPTPDPTPNPTPDPIPITQMTLPQTAITMREGKSKELTPEILPANATNTRLEWTTSDEAVVTVDTSGVLTAVSVGNATITAKTTDGSALSVSCEVEVLPGSVAAMNHTKAYYVYNMDRNAAQYKNVYTEEGKESESLMEASKISSSVVGLSMYFFRHGSITTPEKFSDFMDEMSTSEIFSIFGTEGLNIKGDMENITVVESGKQVTDPNGLSTKSSKISFMLKGKDFSMEIYDNGSRIAMYRPSINSENPIFEFYQNNTDYTYVVRFAKFYSAVLMDDMDSFPNLKYMEMYNIY